LGLRRKEEAEAASDLLAIVANLAYSTKQSLADQFGEANSDPYYITGPGLEYKYFIGVL
jgi:hypothetical protein